MRAKFSGFWPLLGLVALVLLNAVHDPGFLKITVLEGRLYGVPIDILVQGSRTMLVALGMTLVIATGGVDLSVGSVVAITGAVCAVLLQGGQALAVTLAAALGVGLLAGAVNGVLVARCGVQPIVATLILMVAGRGVAQLVVDGQVIIISHAGFEYLANGFLLGLPVAPLLVAAFYLATHLVMRRTALGLFVEAVGDNEKASRFAGLAAANIKTVAYVFCGACAGLAGVLAAKERLHHFATDWLSEDELHDGLLLAALALVLLPLLPAEPLAWLGALSPRRVAMLVLLILLMQAASHLGQRLLGPRAGLPLSGLLGGFVSSTATVGAMGSLVRNGQVPLRLGLCAAVLSTAATWVQVLAMAAVVSPTHVLPWIPMAALGVTVPALVGLILWRLDGQAPQQVERTPSGRVLRLREAALVAALLVGGAVLVHWAQQRGSAGLLTATAIAALADAHAPVAALLSMYRAEQVALGLGVAGVLVAVSVNSLTRTVVATVSGGPRFGALVAGALLCNLSVVWGAWALGYLT